MRKQRYIEFCDFFSYSYITVKKVLYNLEKTHIIYKLHKFLWFLKYFANTLCRFFIILVRILILEDMY